MGATYLVIVIIKNYQMSNNDSSFSSIFKSLIITIFISLINISLRFVIRKLVELERRTSYSIREDVIVKRIGISYFITNGLIILLTFRLFESDWGLWAESGVIFTITLIAIFSIIVDGLYDIVHIEHIMKVFERIYLKYRLKKGYKVY